MDYLTRYYKNLSEQLEDRVNYLKKLLESNFESEGEVFQEPRPVLSREELNARLAKKLGVEPFSSETLINRDYWRMLPIDRYDNPELVPSNPTSDILSRQVERHVYMNPEEERAATAAAGLGRLIRNIGLSYEHIAQIAPHLLDLGQQIASNPDAVWEKTPDIPDDITTNLQSARERQRLTAQTAADIHNANIT